MGEVIIFGFLVFVVTAAATETWRDVLLRWRAQRRLRDELRPRRRHGQ